jgi:hypothetical protein
MGFWDTTVIDKPKGVKDPDAILDYPVDFSDWLTDISDTYASHTVITSDGLTEDSSSESAGVITVFISGGVEGVTEWFTVRITTTGGRTDDRTLYLKIKER